MSDPMIVGRLYDNEFSSFEEAHAVFEDGLMRLTTAKGIVRHVPMDRIDWSSRIAGVPRVANLPDGYVFETRDDDAVDRLIGVRSTLFKLEMSWRLVIVSTLFVSMGLGFFAFFVLPRAAVLAGRAMPDKVVVWVSDYSRKLIEDSYLDESRLEPKIQARWRKGFAKLEKEHGIVIHIRDGGVIGANAFALPDGTVYVTDQLLESLKTRARVDAVLLHEVAHVKLRHSMSHMVESLTVDVILSTVLPNEQAKAVSGHLLAGVYSRLDELEADQWAAEKLKARGDDPALLGEALALIEEAHDDGGKYKLPSFLSTHPRTTDRVARLKGIDEETVIAEADAAKAKSAAAAERIEKALRAKALADEEKTLPVVTCEAYCRFTNAGGGIERSYLEKTAASKSAGWKTMSAACAKLGSGAGELQVANPKFRPCGEGDSAEACAEPEFFEATEKTVCL